MVSINRVIILARRVDGLPRCQAVHPDHGQCRGIAGIEGHVHYGPLNNRWDERAA